MSVNIQEYIERKYGGKAISIGYHEAKAFGVPFPLRSGWFKEFGCINITDARREYIVLQCQQDAKGDPVKGKTKSAIKILKVLGAITPDTAYIEPSSVHKKQRKRIKALNRQAAPSSNATSVAKFRAMSSIDVTSAKFLESFEWRSPRMLAFKHYGLTCQCCGADRSTGAVMHVDHIQPRKTHPHLALELNNLQVLCHECNHGKGNWDNTDWRT